MEGLLFSFGVGIGVMSIMESSESEIDRLGRLLQESEERIEHLNDLLRESRQITADFGGLSSQQLLLAGSISSDGRVFVEVCMISVVCVFSLGEAPSDFFQTWRRFVVL